MTPHMVSSNTVLLLCRFNAEVKITLYREPLCLCLYKGLVQNLLCSYVCLNSTEILHWYMVCDLIYFVDLLAVSAGTCLNQICVIRASMKRQLCISVEWWHDGSKSFYKWKLGWSEKVLLMFSEWHAASIGDKLPYKTLMFLFHLMSWC